ncbi:GntR family transcriptional regulator [Streptomyces sp. C8S0]|uniref:GntR family transcriptional regulator n=1 Tax=Streptomyces sp. C8S0 TaxID=2585716 RepID=UPI001866AE8B|nr:GntR family transcriptional regulator [Streptomyces sp. C8S0]
MPGPDRAGVGAQQPRARGAGAGPDLPMLLTLREELRSGVWRPGTVRTLAGLRVRFGETQLMATAVTRVLRDEGLVALDGFPGVRALGPAGRPPHRTSTATDLVVEAIRKRLTDHIYQPGERMPSQQALAVELDTSRTTVQLALVQLRLEGLLRPIRCPRRPGPTSSIRRGRPGRRFSWPTCGWRCAGAGGRGRSTPMSSSARCTFSSAPPDERG